MTAHRLLATCLLLSAPADVFAEMIGSPVSHPDAGRFSIGATGEVGAVLVNAQDCEGDACQAVWRPAQVGGRAELVLARGLGLQGGGSWLHEDIPEAGYSGNGSSAWGGLELALPVGADLWVAAVGQYHFTFTDDSSLNTTEETRSSRVKLAGLLAWAPDDHGAVVYGGLSVHPLYQQRTLLDRYELEIEFHPVQPPGVVVGIELRSQPLGLPWSGNSGRMLMGVELRAESGVAGGIWLAAAF